MAYDEIRRLAIIHMSTDGDQGFASSASSWSKILKTDFLVI